MAPRTRDTEPPDEATPVERRPKRLRGVIMAFLAAFNIIIVTAVVTTIVVDTIHGRSNPLVDATTQQGQSSDPVADARTAGYKAGVRDTKQQNRDKLDARYDQGFAKGYAKGRSDVENDQGEVGGYAEGFNAGVTAAVDAYKKVIAQAQQIIAEANQQPAATVPATTSTG
jgi:hypothetical protein